MSLQNNLSIYNETQYSKWNFDQMKTGLVKTTSNIQQVRNVKNTWIDSNINRRI